jgi:hypothetical protein
MMTGRVEASVGPNTGRRYWARRMIDKAKGAQLPVYGDATWLSLPDGDPVKVASVIVAAESWASLGDDIPGRLTIEVAASYVANKQAEDAAYEARAEAHREAYETVRRGTYEQTRQDVISLDKWRAARIAEAVKPRPGDYRGRSGA